MAYHSKKEPSYSPLTGDDHSSEGEAEAASFFHYGLEQMKRQSPMKTLLKTVLPWALATAFAILYATTFVPRKHGSFESGFRTEFGPALGEIEVEEVRFTSGVLFTEDGEPYRTKYPGQLDYVGPPSSDIDQNWEALIGARYFSVTGKEAENIGGEENHKTWDRSREWGYLSGFDVLHSLHCVNMVRKGLDGDYYYPEYDLYEHHSRNHLDHCLDHLRQSIMCHGDLTPLTTVYWPQIDASFAHSEQTHTCRNYQKIRDFTTQRYNGSLANVKLSPEFLATGKGKGRDPKGGHCPGCLTGGLGGNGGSQGGSSLDRVDA